jgi:hypothetical protein
LSAIPHLLSRYVLHYFRIRHLPSMPSFYPMTGITLSINNSFPFIPTPICRKEAPVPEYRPQIPRIAEGLVLPRAPACFNLAFALRRLPAPYHPRNLLIDNETTSSRHVPTSASDFCRAKINRFRGPLLSLSNSSVLGKLCQESLTDFAFYSFVDPHDRYSILNRHDLMSDPSTCTFLRSCSR